LRVGYAAAQLAQLWGKPKGKKAWAPSDFMPNFDGPRKAASPQQWLDRMVTITKLMGGKIINKRKG